jgi:hypothetical protein
MSSCSIAGAPASLEKEEEQEVVDSPRSGLSHLCLLRDIAQKMISQATGKMGYTTSEVGDLVVAAL